MARKTVQWLRVHATLAEDLSFIPSTFRGWLLTFCNSTSVGSDAIFWPLKAPALKYRYTETNMHAYD